MTPGYSAPRLLRDLSLARLFHFFVFVSVVFVVVVEALVAGTAVATVSTVAAEAEAAADSTGAALTAADAVTDAEAAASPLDSAPLQPPRTTQHTIAIKFFILSYLLKSPLVGRA